MRKTNQKGFTIIELLVVIVIIGILVALALPQLFAAQARGRDTERKNDMKNIKTQLETYFNDHNEYPADLDDISELTDDDKQDPKGVEYTYAQLNDGDTYTLTTTLENKDDSAVTGANGQYQIKSVNQASTEEEETP